MATTELMGWNKGQRRWFKRHETKLYAVGCPTLQKQYPDLFHERTREGSRAAANQWWQDQLAALQEKPDDREHAGYWHGALKQARARRGWCLTHEDADQAAFYQNEIQRIEGILKQTALPDPPKIEIFVRPGEPRPKALRNIMDVVWADRLARAKPRGKHSVSNLIEKFIQSSKGNVAGLGVTPDRAFKMQFDLDHFGRWFGEQDIRDLKGLALVEFRGHLLEQCGAGKMSRARARDIIVTLRRFVRWCWQTAEVIDQPPRNLDSRDLSISVPVRSVEVFADDELAMLLERCPERQKLFYLLMLNTGMTPWEISNLANHDDARRNEADYFHTPRLDWKTGRIVRKRSKTKAHKNVPTVDVRLWDETLRLLSLSGNSKGNPVLTNEDGGPLVEKTNQADTKPVRNDCIGRAFRRLRKRLNRDEQKLRHDLKALRATAASKLDNSNEFARFATYFLGHSPRGIADRHYVQPSSDQFDKAVQWLGEQFGFSTSDIVVTRTRKANDHTRRVADRTKTSQVRSVSQSGV